ncbi:MAG: hypothetical protein Q8J76_00805, partial [Desulfobulbaceae bacterium]|nr:hypothetical protein [Desulfobulbaceae bacterium]
MNNNDNIFRLLEQDGPFATEESTIEPRLFSPVTRIFARRLAETGLVNRYRIVRDQVFEFLHVNSLADAHRLILDEQHRDAASCRAYSLIGNMFGIGGDEHKCRAAISNYSRTADGVVHYLKSNILAPYAPYFEMTNKICTISDPVELLLIPLDDRYHKKARFEAKRKLILMSLAASIEQRERETEIEQKFSRFLDFLNEHVWSQDAKIGEVEPALLLSRHNHDDFSCCEVTVFPWKEAIGLQHELGTKRTLIKRLWFHAQGRKIPIYVTVRKKESEAKVLKLLRKGMEYPDIAVDDELGLMGVLDQIGDVRIFQKHLVESAIRAGSFLTLEDVSDSLANSSQRNGNVGSSNKTP